MQICSEERLRAVGATTSTGFLPLQTVRQTTGARFSLLWDEGGGSRVGREEGEEEELWRREGSKGFLGAAMDGLDGGGRGRGEGREQKGEIFGVQNLNWGGRVAGTVITSREMRHERSKFHL